MPFLVHFNNHNLSCRLLQISTQTLHRKLPESRSVYYDAETNVHLCMQWLFIFYSSLNTDIPIEKLLQMISILRYVLGAFKATSKGPRSVSDLS